MSLPQNPLAILKNAFSKLKKSTEKHQKALLALLSKKEKLSDADEKWLDSNGNLVDEQCVIEELDAASDFEQGVQQLLDHAFGQLRQAAGLEHVSKKRKCAHLNKLSS